MRMCETCPFRDPEFHPSELGSGNIGFWEIGDCHETEAQVCAGLFAFKKTLTSINRNALMLEGERVTAAPISNEAIHL